MEQCVRARQPFPAKLENAPQLWEGLRLYYLAFLDLTSCRALGQSQGPIPWLAIVKYCELHEIEDELLEDMLYYIPRMDRAYLKWSANKTKQDLAAAQAQQSSGTKTRQKR